MIQWVDHEKLRDKHAFLSASGYHWINWSEDICNKRFESNFSTDTGTILHKLASDLIKMKTKITMDDKNLIDYTLRINGIPRSVYNTEEILLNLIPFVNDCIGYRMSSEIILYYSPYCFGTTDAIGYSDIEKVLRVSDYKSGNTPAHMEQLKIYAALFCLEYKKDPAKLKGIELRIYQNGEIATELPTAEEIQKYMNVIKTKSGWVQNLFERG